MNLQQQLGEWYPLLSHVFKEPWMQKLGKRLGAVKDKVQPIEDNWFRAFRLCPPDHLKVVIIGQDPYINGEADGLSFSSFGKVTPSLEAVLEEINRTHQYKRAQTHLDDWAQQGVLLLNAVLTTNMGKSRAHAGWGWELFTQEVLHVIRKRDSPVVFILWGKDAQNVVNQFKPTDRSTPMFPWRILKAHHPQAQNYNPANKFVGCNHFIEANLYLMKNRRHPIWWPDPEHLMEDSVYKHYCLTLLKQIPDVEDYWSKILYSNPSVSNEPHPFHDRLESGYEEDLPF